MEIDKIVAVAVSGIILESLSFFIAATGGLDVADAAMLGLRNPSSTRSRNRLKTSDPMVGVPVLYNRPRLRAQGPCTCGFPTPRSQVSIARALADRGLVGLQLSEPIKWDKRAMLPERAGVYVIVRGDSANTVYIGRTWSVKGIRSRIRAFHGSATSGQQGNAGGVTFHNMFNGDASTLWISVHLPDWINPRPEILRPYIAYAERRVIWEYVEAHGALPVCNSE